MLKAAPAEFRNAIARKGWSVLFAQWRLLGLVALLLACSPQKTLAQHCGRIGFVVSTEGDTLSWERGDAGLSAAAGGAGSARIRTSGCEGPLCRSQTPEPFSPGSFADSPAMPFPWKCTALASISPEPDPVTRADAFDVTLFETPYFDPIPDPPRIG